MQPASQLVLYTFELQVQQAAPLDLQGASLSRHPPVWLHVWVQPGADGWCSRLRSSPTPTGIAKQVLHHSRLQPCHAGPHWEDAVNVSRVDQDLEVRLQQRMPLGQHGQKQVLPAHRAVRIICGQAASRDCDDGLPGPRCCQSSLGCRAGVLAQLAVPGALPQDLRLVLGGPQHCAVVPAAPPGSLAS